MSSPPDIHVHSEWSWDALHGSMERSCARATALGLPATFLVAEVASEMVGRVSIRHQLNDFLARYGGHIGYGVRPQFRRRGYATTMLRRGLVVAREVGVADVLITCDVDNVASVKVIERCGGIFEGIETEGADSAAKRRYWIRQARSTDAGRS